MVKKLTAYVLIISTVLAAQVAIAAVYDNWTQKSVSGSWAASACSTNCDYMVASQSPGEIYLSSDFGSSWVAKTTSTSRSWTGLAMSGTGQIIYATASNSYIYKSTDFGSTWSALTSLGTASWSDVATSSNGSVVAATISAGSLYTSIDAGSTWSQQSTVGTAVGWTATDVSPDGTSIAVAASTGAIFLGTGTVGSWSWSNITSGKTAYSPPTSISGLSWKSVVLDSSGTRLAAVSNELYFTKDSGASWSKLTGGNYSFSGVTGTADLKLILVTNSASCINCRPTVFSTTDYVTFNSYYSANALYPGYSSITIGKDGARAVATTTSSYLYISGSIPTSSTISISSPTSVIYRSANTVTATLTPSTGGRVTFFANGKRIAGCISLLANSGSISCSWKPTNRGSIQVYARYIPTDTVYTPSTSATRNVLVGNRVSTR